MSVIRYLLVYLAGVNIVGLAAMGIDKWKARNRAWRIPEATLFTIAIIGGSIGSMIGMQLFRHKTKHASFVIGMPVILVLQVGLVLFLCWGPLQISIF